MRHITEPEPKPDSPSQHVVTGPDNALEFVQTTDANGNAKRLVTPTIEDEQTRDQNI